MELLLKKFPIHGNVEWNKHLVKKDQATQSKPFMEFTLWLEKSGKIWELLVANNTGVQNRTGSKTSHFGNTESIKCFSCGESRHVKRDCVKKNSSSKDQGARGAKGSPKMRNKPKYRKFHCTLHKGGNERFCSTQSCFPIKNLSFAERIKLLKENLDCSNCAGDCEPGKCIH